MSPSAPSPFRYRARPGRIVTYRFEGSHGIYLQVASPIAETQLPPQETHTSLNARLVCASYAWDDPEVLLLGFRLEKPAIRIQSALAEIPVESGQLGEEFFALMTDQGRFERFYFPLAMDVQIRDLIKAWILQTQILFPEEFLPRWETAEEDLTGRFQARYRADGGSIRKEKCRYEELYGHFHGTGPSPQLEAIPSGESTCLFSALGYPISVHVRGALKLQSAGLLEEGRVTEQGSMEFIRESTDPVRASWSAAEMKRRLSSYGSSAPGRPEGVEQGMAQSQEARRRELARGKTLSGLLASLEGLARLGRLEEMETLRTLEQLGALLALDEGEIQKLLAFLRSGGIHPEVASLLPGALASADTPAAQAALVNLLEDSTLTEDLRAASLMALGTCTAPTVDSEEALRKIVLQSDRGDLALNALLILGVFSHRTRSLNGDPSGGLVDFLLKQEASLASEGNATLFLEALGNAGDAKGYPAVARYLQDANDDVRATAVYALRFMASPKVTSDLMAALSDPSAEVRKRALEAAALQPSSPELQAAVESYEAIRK